MTDHNQQLLRSYLIVGIFALLVTSEIILVATGVTKLDDLRSWIALVTRYF